MTEPNTPQYINPLILHRADPFIFKHTDGYYYFTASHTDAEHNLDGKYQYRKILIRRAASINDLSDSVGNYSERCVYEREPICGNRSPHIWAPEIHFIRGNGTYISQQPSPTRMCGRYVHMPCAVTATL